MRRVQVDRQPSREHECWLNAPTSSEVTLVIVEQEFEKRDIILQGRDAGLKRISETDLMMLSSFSYFLPW